MLTDSVARKMQLTIYVDYKNLTQLKASCYICMEKHVFFIFFLVGEYKVREFQQGGLLRM
jgi:hypothetical protein